MMMMSGSYGGEALFVASVTLAALQSPAHGVNARVSSSPLCEEQLLSINAHNWEVIASGTWETSRHESSAVRST